MKLLRVLLIFGAVFTTVTSLLLQSPSDRSYGNQHLMNIPKFCYSDQELNNTRQTGDHYFTLYCMSRTAMRGKATATDDIMAARHNVMVQLYRLLLHPYLAPVASFSQSAVFADVLSRHMLQRDCSAIRIALWFFAVMYSAVYCEYQAEETRKPDLIRVPSMSCARALPCFIMHDSRRHWFLTRSSAVSERPLDASCHWIFC